MVLQKLISLLLANPQIGGRLVQTLADSWPIRRAAKFTAYLYLRGKDAIEKEGLQEIAKKVDGQRFAQNFKEEMKKQFDEAKRKEIERQKRR